jgi:hypothetical protein
MADSTAQLLSNHAEQLKRILTKHKSGKSLTAQELKLIGGGADSRPTDPRSFDSIGSASAAMKVPVATLRWAKRQGAPGFRGSRVYPEELAPWLCAREDKGGGLDDRDKHALECRRLRQRIDREAFEFERERGQWIRVEEVETFVGELAQLIRTTLRNKLRNELPPKLEGLRAAEMSAKLESFLPDLIESLRKPLPVPVPKRD